MTHMFSVQIYCWVQVYEQQKKNAHDYMEEVLAQTKEAGYQAIELSFPTKENADRARELLPKSGLKLPSMYVGGKMHEENWRETVELAATKARWGREFGAKVVVVNPDPIAWGKLLDKTDDQLKRQAEALQTLGEKVSAEGMQLAYHTHDAEMRQSAREFHHMMQATDAEHVGFCFDTHWVFRGAGNSQLAMFDVFKMYKSRLKSLHLRQSQAGVWTETFGEGDIDYPRLANLLREMNFQGPMTLEQCFETGTELKLPPVERFKRTREAAEKIFNHQGK